MPETSKQNGETENLLSSAPTEVVIEGKDSLDILTPEKKPLVRRSRCSCCRWHVCLIVFLLVIYILSMTYLLIFPVIFHVCPSFQRELVFFNDLLRNVTDPVVRGLNCTTVMHLDSDGDIRLGAWHIPPVSECNSELPLKTPREALSGAKLVVLYAHGSGSNRGNKFRVEAYEVFITHLNAHVVTFDYRGFGDSTPLEEQPSVAGVVNDTRHVYNWLLSTGVPPERILLWGHSLGTSIMVHMLSTLSTGQNPMATVLEAPFTSFVEEIPEHPMNKIYRYLPWFDYLILDPLVDNPELNFDSISLLPAVRCPLLVLHAIDDPIVPFFLGKKLYDTARQVQPPGIANKTHFHAFGKSFRHNYIRRAPDLPKVVIDFIKSI